MTLGCDTADVKRDGGLEVTPSVGFEIDMHCNHRRPHGALSHKPPIARLNELNNLAGSYTWRW
jgi:hypothetical protein